MAEERERTSVNLPLDLLQEARIQAIRERIDLQDLIAEGIRMYLKKNIGVEA